MAFINIATREIHCKIVYYGIGYCGKTTNLQYVHKSINPQVRGDLLSIKTDTERTLFFDFLPLELGQIQNFRTRFYLYTVPGQILYERTRLAVLNGADGIVFVVDSQAEKFEADSYGFRPGRSAQDAIQAIFIYICKQPKYVLDADIANCFDHAS